MFESVSRSFLSVRAASRSRSGRSTQWDTSTSWRVSVLGPGLRHFYVVDSDGVLRGLIVLAERAAVPERERMSTRADEIMPPIADLASVVPDDTAWTALRRMAETGVGQLPVIERGRLCGTVRREHLPDLVRGAPALQSP